MARTRPYQPEHLAAARRWINRLEAHPACVIAAVGLLFAILYLGTHLVFPRSHGRIVNGDAIQYYAYLRSIVIDGDVDFANDYRLLNSGSWDLSSSRPEGTDVAPPETYPRNFVSIGPALLWMPAFLLVAISTVGLQTIGFEVPVDGIWAPFPLSAGLAGIAYATAGVYLCYRVCRRIYPSAVAFWATLVVWLGTSAIYYSLVSPMYSHAMSLFAVALFCHTWLRTRHRDGVGRSLMLGALAGLAALVRWQDIVILALPLIELAHASARRERPLARTALQALALGPPLLLMLLPQFLAWRALFGHYVVMPQGPGFMRWTEPALWSVLFSWNHGLFTWTPAALLGVLGLRTLIRRDVVLGWGTVAILASAAYVNASVTDWWAGEAFGARRFVGYSVFFGLGVAGCLSSLTASRRRLSWMRRSAVGMIAYNGLFLLQYQLFMRGFEELAPYPATWRLVLLDRFVVPWRLLRDWWLST